MKRHEMTKRKAVRYSIFIGLATPAVFFITPYFWMLSSSFKSTQEILVNSRYLLPLEPTLNGHEKALTQFPSFTWFKNNAFITVTNTVIILLTSALVGYVFSKFQFKRKKLLFAILLASMMAPAQTTMIPSFLLINSLGSYNSAGALILFSFVNALGIYLCRQFCDEILGELIESAKLDGVEDFTIFWKIIIPQIRPVLGALAIFTFLNHWNDYLNLLIMLSEVKKMTLLLVLFSSASQHMADPSATTAASALIMVPVTVIFMILQKHFIKGIAIIGVK